MHPSNKVFLTVMMLSLIVNMMLILCGIWQECSHFSDYTVDQHSIKVNRNAIVILLEYFIL